MKSCELTQNLSEPCILQGMYGLVLMGAIKDRLDELAQPQALRFYGQLWKDRFEAMLSHSFAASFIVELMGSNLR